MNGRGHHLPMGTPSNYTTSRIQTEFVDSDRETADAIFNDYLGIDNAWFGALLYEIKEEWIAKGSPITDILIRENAPVMLALIKAHVPFESVRSKTAGRNILLLSRSKIVDMVKKFVPIDETFTSGTSYDFSFYVMGLGIFRGNYSVDTTGVGVSLRYLSFDIPTFSSVGYPPFYKKEIEKLVEYVSVKTPTKIVKSGVVRQGGLIIHVGPTGSGKTTSMAAEVGYLADETSGAIITYENPIEYRLSATRAPVRQFEIGKDIKADAENTLLDNMMRHLLRNNPSVVLIGEGRDSKDIRAMMDTALKGHLVLGTIHASDVKEALTTMLSVAKGEEYIVATSIRAIVAHRLFTSKTGEIIPLFEILIPTPQDRKNILEGRIEQVANALSGKDSKHVSGISFEKHIEELVKYGSISPTEGNELSPIFEKERKKG